MGRRSFRERALVVRSYDFGEADRIVVLLTRDRGLVRCVAKGVRRTRSRFGSRLQPFVELDVSLYEGARLCTITSADTVAYFGAGLIDDPLRYAAGCVVLEASESIADVPDPNVYQLAVKALADLQRTPEPELALDQFLLRLMTLAGWAPSLFACAQCGRPGPHHAFHPGAGGAVCVRCRPTGATEVDPEALHLVWLLREGSYVGKNFLTKERVVEAHHLVRAHLQWHLERRLRSLQVMDQV